MGDVYYDEYIINFIQSYLKDNMILGRNRCDICRCLPIKSRTLFYTSFYYNNYNYDNYFIKSIPASELLYSSGAAFNNLFIISINKHVLYTYGNLVWEIANLIKSIMICIYKKASTYKNADIYYMHDFNSYPINDYVYKYVGQPYFILMLSFNIRKIYKKARQLPFMLYCFPLSNTILTFSLINSRFIFNEQKYNTYDDVDNVIQNMALEIAKKYYKYNSQLDNNDISVEDISISWFDKDSQIIIGNIIRNIMIHSKDDNVSTCFVEYRESNSKDRHIYLKDINTDIDLFRYLTNNILYEGNIIINDISKMNIDDFVTEFNYYYSTNLKLIKVFKIEEGILKQLNGNIIQKEKHFHAS